MEALTLTLQLKDMFTNQLNIIQKRVGDFQTKIESMKNTMNSSMSSMTSAITKLGLAFTSFFAVQKMMAKSDELFLSKGGSIEDTFEGQFSKLRTTLDKALEPIYEEFHKILELGILQTYIERIGDAIQYILKYSEKLVPILKSVVSGLVAFKVASYVASIASIAGFSLSTGAAIGLSVAIGAVVLALDKVVASYNQLTGSSETTFGVISGYFNMLIGSIEMRLTHLQNMFVIVANFLRNVFTDPIGSIKQLWNDVVDEMSEYWSTKIEYMGQIFNVLKSGVQALAKVLGVSFEDGGSSTNFKRKSYSKVTAQERNEQGKTWANSLSSRRSADMESSFDPYGFLSDNEKSAVSDSYKVDPFHNTPANGNNTTVGTVNVTVAMDKVADTAPGTTTESWISSFCTKLAEALRNLPEEGHFS